MKKLLIGGSPCTKWSIAQKNREIIPSGEGWELFLNFIIAKEKFKPDYFLYENNWSASSLIKEQISKELKEDIIRINSNLVSAQNRDRFYVFNWNYTPIKDRNIYLQDILEYGTTERKKSKTVRVGGRNSGWTDKHEWDMPNSQRTYTLTEIHRLQTMPDNYCVSVSETAAWKALGNGWTAELIIELLSQGLNFKKDEKLIVLSLYDGIGTGRYCLDKMGFNNIKYFAYEIDKNAKKIAMSNYPDIIQCGDAFEIRKTDWVLK
jgi:site-specific DNA-cytosine methylase